MAPHRPFPGKSALSAERRMGSSEGMGGQQFVIRGSAEHLGRPRDPSPRVPAPAPCQPGSPGMAAILQGGGSERG